MSAPVLLKSANPQGVPSTFRWRPLFSGSSEVGVFRLKPGSDYLKREMEFRPMVPFPLKQGKLGEYLEREFKEFWVDFDEEGGVSLRLGPNQMLGPVAGRIAFVYKIMMPKNFEGDNNVSKQANTQKLQGH